MVVDVMSVPCGTGRRRFRTKGRTMTQTQNQTEAVEAVAGAVDAEQTVKTQSEADAELTKAIRVASLQGMTTLFSTDADDKAAVRAFQMHCKGSYLTAKRSIELPKAKEAAKRQKALAKRHRLAV